MTMKTPATIEELSEELDRLGQRLRGAIVERYPLGARLRVKIGTHVVEGTVERAGGVPAMVTPREPWQVDLRNEKTGKVRVFDGRRTGVVTFLGAADLTDRTDATYRTDSGEETGTANSEL